MSVFDETHKMMKRCEGWEVMQRLYILRCECFPDWHKSHPIKNFEGVELPELSKRLNDLAIERKKDDKINIKDFFEKNKERL